jgi:large subunit ribosomal protein L25
MADGIEVDVSDLGAAESLHASDIKLPPGIRFASHDDFTIATISLAVQEASAPQSADNASPAKDDKDKKEDKK